MSRMFFATALVVASSVGVPASAGESLSEGSGDPFRIPQSVIQYLSEKDQAAPISLTDAEDLPIVRSPDPELTVTEVTPVPLPAPVWTGAAGLLGLGAIRLYHRLRHSFRYG